MVQYKELILRLVLRDARNLFKPYEKLPLNSKNDFKASVMLFM